MSDLSKLPLAQLLDRYLAPCDHPDLPDHSAPAPTALLHLLLTHPEIVSSIKNQSPLLRKMYLLATQDSPTRTSPC